METTEKYDKLCAMVYTMANESLDNFKGFYVGLVIVPHHEFRTQTSKVIADAFIKAGFSVTKRVASYVEGDEFRVLIRAISVDAGRGMSMDAILFPNAEGLTPRQVKIAEEHHSNIYPCIAPHGGKFYEY